MTIELKIKVEDIRKIYDLPRNLGKGSRKLLDEMHRNVSTNLKGNILNTLFRRFGYTRELSDRNMWSVTSSKTGERGRSITVTTPIGYAGYLNEPHGPYPFAIDRTRLSNWMTAKGYKGLSLRRLARQIRSGGHQTKRGEAFMDEAVASTLEDYDGFFGADVQQSFSSIFK